MSPGDWARYAKFKARHSSASPTPHAQGGADTTNSTLPRAPPVRLSAVPPAAAPVLPARQPNSGYVRLIDEEEHEPSATSDAAQLNA